MAVISAALVKDLRDKTGAGMMDCKKALGETGGDLETAVDWLRKKGLAAAAKKSGRAAGEGLVGVASGPLAAAMIEVNAETDFVARNEQFQLFVETAARLVLEHGDDLVALQTLPYPGSDRSVADELTQLIATIGENMTIRRARRLAAASGTVASYVHQALKPGLGRIGVLVAVEGPDTEIDALELLGRQVGMHVAATRPDSLDVSSVDPSALERERAVLTEQARASGKSNELIDKMVNGRIQKYYKEVVLLEQVWVHDGESRVEAIVQKSGATLTGFARFQLGEGVEKESGDFAAEVAAAAGIGQSAPD